MEMNQEPEYRLLDRLRQDNDYFLGNGNGAAKHLWAKNIKDQIAKMKKLWMQLKVKPEWLTMDQIKDYEEKMSQKQ